MLCTITDIIVNIASVTGVWLIAERFTGIGGLGKYQILFLLGYSLGVSGIINTFFNWNILHISRRIGRGQLDHVLMQPQSVWVTLLTEGFIPASGSGVLVTGIILLCYAISKLHWTVTIGWILLLLASLVFSAVINLSYSLLWGSMAFYAPTAAEEVCTSIVDLFSTVRNFPLNGMGRVWQLILLSIIPVGFCAWYPTIAFTSDRIYIGLVLIFTFAVLFMAATIIAFKKGLKHYVRKGAYRYHDRGHRR